jgi:hypothetical protein
MKNDSAPSTRLNSIKRPQDSHQIGDNQITTLRVDQAHDLHYREHIPQ